MKQSYYYIGIILVIIILLTMPKKSAASDTTKIKMGGTYTTSYGKVKEVYLDKSRSKLFYMRSKVKRYYFRKVKL